jgi:hypothetical protein
MSPSVTAADVSACVPPPEVPPPVVPPPPSPVGEVGVLLSLLHGEQARGQQAADQ